MSPEATAAGAAAAAGEPAAATDADDILNDAVAGQIPPVTSRLIRGRGGRGSLSVMGSPDDPLDSVSGTARPLEAGHPTQSTLATALAESAAAGIFGSTPGAAPSITSSRSGTPPPLPPSPPPPAGSSTPPRWKSSPPKNRSMSMSATAQPLSPGSAAERIASLNERFAATISKHSIRRTSQDSAATARPRSASFKPLPAAVEEDSFEIDEIALQAKALSARVDMLSSAPQPRISCPCCLVIDADDPSFCRQCKGHFVEVIRLQLERDSVQAVLNDEKTRLESLNAKEEMARQDAAKLSERVGELEKLMDAKAEEQARLQMDLQRMGEKIIEEIEKRAELQVSRDTLQDELEELTKSLFEEANVMVADEARKRHHHETREKTLEQELADLKVELQMEQLQLRELQIKMEESQAAAATRHRQHQQSEGSRPLSQSISLAPEDIIDPMLLMEFQDFLKHGPTVKLNKIHTLPFMKNVIDDDVTPCLRFGGNPRTSTKRLMDAILMNSCFVEEMSPSQISALQYQHQCLKEAADPGSPNAPSRSGARRASSMDPDKAGVIAAVAASMSTPTQSIFQKTVLERLSTTWSIATTSSNASNLPPSIVVDGCSTCGRIGPTRHHFKISELASDTWSPICGSCRDRLVSVCEFYNFVRHVRQGLYSTRRHEDLFQEVLSLKRKMFFSRMGAFPFLAAERSLNTRQLLRPDSQLLKDFEIASASNSPALSALPVAASGGVSESGTRAGSPGLPRVSMGAALKRINEEPSLTPAVKGGRVGSISEV